MIYVYLALAFIVALIFALAMGNAAQWYPPTRCKCGEMMNRWGYCEKCYRAIE